MNTEVFVLETNGARRRRGNRRSARACTARCNSAPQPHTVHAPRPALRCRTRSIKHSCLDVCKDTLGDRQRRQAPETRINQGGWREDTAQGKLGKVVSPAIACPIARGDPTQHGLLKGEVRRDPPRPNCRASSGDQLPEVPITPLKQMIGSTVNDSKYTVDNRLTVQYKGCG